MNTVLKHYQNTAVPQCSELLGEDIVSFSVLASIVKDICTDIFTNHQSVVICYSTAPFPVWVWCKDIGNADDVSAVAHCLKEHFSLKEGYTYNISHDLLDALQQLDPVFKDITITMELLSYRLTQIKDTYRPFEGSITLARTDETEYLCKLYNRMHKEMEDYDFSYEHCKNEVQKFLAKEAMFALRDSEGNIQALTTRWDEGRYSKVSSVYTLPHARRRGYANNLVHYVTQTILSDGMIPTLYTNADYSASNECYQKIGYEQVGRICTAAANKEEK